MKLHVINSMATGTMRVHADGCHDVARELNSANIDWNVKASTRREVMVDIWDDEADNYGVDITHPDHVAATEFLPCTTGLGEDV